MNQLIQDTMQSPQVETPVQEPSPAAMIGRVVVLVRDYQAALEFYREALGAQVIFDQTVGGQRFLHLGFPAQPAGGLAPVGLWLLRAEGEDEALVGRQAGGQPFLVLYTADCHAALKRFTEAGGRVRRPLRETPDSLYAHVEDLYGNEIVVAQLRPAS